MMTAHPFVCVRALAIKNILSGFFGGLKTRRFTGRDVLA